MELQVRGLSAGYEDHLVLDDVSLRLGTRRTTVVLGPGGSGKSTLLKVLAGSAPVPGFWRRGYVSAPEAVGWLPQRRHAPATSLACLVSPARPDAAAEVAHRVWSDEPRIREALVSGLDDAPVDTNLWRLAAFTGVVGSDAPALLLDEPDVALEPVWLAALARKLSRERGRRTVVLVTHHLLLARMVSDVAVLLVDGQVLEAAENMDFFERPAQQRTRDFIRMGG